MNANPQREAALFQAALQLTGNARALFLENACEGDAALRQRLEALLAAHEQTEGALADAPPPAVKATMKIEFGEATDETVGQQIGRYKILEKVGEGGCGVVYVAEQTEPVRRRVALKVIKLGMDTKQVVARFEAERQALALMDHPNIAKVLDAGATEKGRPYFVMELVRGIKITEYCDQNQLNTGARLGLFVQVCHAIQHAHQKGIIHRDIKPSNVLVADVDGSPVPKVIDFGIAKATAGQQLSNKTIFTAIEQFIGTPAYMSPEQAQLTSLDIDTRSDVYSLGVLLYELLTGKTPFDAKSLFNAGLDEIRRVIREVDPPRPSTRLSTLDADERTEIGKRHGGEGARLLGLIRQDLDWVVMKTLEKDRNRRYETANALAADIQRHLHHEPVVARPPSKFYKLKKMVGRHKTAFAAATITCAALVIGLEISISSLIRAKRATNQAVTSANEANLQTEERKLMAQFWRNTLARVSTQMSRDQETERLKIIIAQTAEQFFPELKDQPSVQAKLRLSLSEFYNDLGDYPMAENMAREGLRTGAGIWSQQAIPMVELKYRLAIALRERGDLDGAAQLFEEILPRLRDDPQAESRDYADALYHQALVRWLQGDLTSAEKLCRESLALKRSRSPDLTLAFPLANLGLILHDQGRLSESETNLAEALSILRPLGKHPAVSGACQNLGVTLLGQGNFDAAERLLREILQDLLAPDHPRAAVARNCLAVTLRRHAALTGDRNQLLEALELYPADQATVEALASSFTAPTENPLFLTSGLSAGATNLSIEWRIAPTNPPPNWIAPEFDDSTWPRSARVNGFPQWSPRSDRAKIFQTNFWLRTSFELTNPPPKTLGLRLNRSQDAEVFINGVAAIPAIDWSDSARVIPLWPAGQAALHPGRNWIAMHCLDVDGGATVEVGICSANDSTFGREKVLQEFDRLMAASPKRADLFAARGSLYARMGRWQSALVDLTRAVELDSGNADYYYLVASLLVETGDVPGYMRIRDQALAKFGNTDSPQLAAQALRICAMRPLDSSQFGPIKKLAERAASAPASPSGLARRQCAKGLADYRLGNLKLAMDWMEQGRITSTRKELPGWGAESQRNRVALCGLVSAMAFHQLGQVQAAQERLGQTEALMHSEIPQRDSTDFGRSWSDWLVNQQLLIEARNLIPSR